MDFPLRARSRISVDDTSMRRLANWPARRGSRGLPRLERLDGGRHEDHAIEGQRVVRVAGDQQVSDVRRIEASAEEADPHSLTGPAAWPAEPSAPPAAAWAPERRDRPA